MTGYNSLRALGALVLILGMGILWNSITVVHDRSHVILMIKKPPASYLSVIQRPGSYFSQEVAKMQTTFSHSFGSSSQVPGIERTSSSAHIDASASSTLHQKNTAFLGARNWTITGLPQKPLQCPSRYLWYLDWIGARTNNQLLALINALHLSAAYGYTLLLSPAAETLLDIAIDGDGLHAHFCIASVSRDLRGSTGQVLWAAGSVPDGSLMRVAGSLGLWAGEDMFRLMPPPGFRVKVAALLLLHAKQQVWKVVQELHRELAEGGGVSVGVHIRKLEGSCFSRLNAATMGSRYRGLTEVCKNELGYVVKEVQKMGGPRFQTLQSQTQTPTNAHSDSKTSLVAKRKKMGGLQLFVAHDAGVVFQAMTSAKPLPLDMLEMAQAVNGSYGQQFAGAFDDDMGDSPGENDDSVANDAELLAEPEPEPDNGGFRARASAQAQTETETQPARVGVDEGRERQGEDEVECERDGGVGDGDDEDRVYYLQRFTGTVLSMPVEEVCAAISDDSLEKYCAKGYEPGGLHLCPPQEPWEGLAFMIATFCRAYEYVQEGAVTSTFAAQAAGLNSEQASLVDMLLLARSTYLVGNPSSTFTSNTVLLRNFLAHPRSSSNVDLEEIGCYGTREPAYEWRLVRQEDARRKWTCQDGRVTTGNYSWYLDEVPWSRWDATSRTATPAS
eukprot:CAMPEP_0177701236 /NCGR_PEP_ID=MMETSP0484_2-20121128/6509_1 /TAXON_ID=354590 /ORGANISM="Rhodomonas lens, Strain RHODO" /LENGTH=671 /DNA_ID=CAMNT_0019212467 /DNA_START=84 /DNA_END=2099 /DNA_ORIENTATION=-